MNTQVIAARPWQAAKRKTAIISKKGMVLVLLIVAILLSAFGVVYTKDLNRRLFIQYQSLQQEQAKAISRFSKLLLEQSTWATQSRVQRIAKNDLNMQLPTSENTVLVTGNE